MPPHAQTLAEQVERVLGNLARKPSELERYISLIALAGRNQTLFYRILVDHIEQMMPIIYTPTVGEACQEYDRIFRRPAGALHFSGRSGPRGGGIAQLAGAECARDRGDRWRAILGLGDLGSDGMGIPIGKLMLYMACAGVHPSQCLPVTIDVGTNNAALLVDPLYFGLRQRRLRGPEYDALVDEFIEAATKLFPQVLIQFEDFGNQNAFRLLERYQERICTFNDDIQGTASVALAGLYSALRITGCSLRDQRVLFSARVKPASESQPFSSRRSLEAGLPQNEARARCWFVDSKGLVVQSRSDLSSHKRVFAQDHEPLTDPVAIIESVRPSVLIGVSAKPGVFSRAVLQAAARQAARPIVFALSNPTSLVECTAEEAYRWTEGRAIFASGSPFDPVSLFGRRFVPGQGKNSYIFPASAWA